MIDSSILKIRFEFIELIPGNATVYSAELLRFMHLEAAHDIDGEQFIL